MKRHLSVGEGYAPKPLNFKPLPHPTCSMKNASRNQKIGWLVMPMNWAKVTGFTGLVALICFCLSVGSVNAQDSIQPLTIGDTIPADFWKQLDSVFNEKEHDTLSSISESELAIIYFWSPYCKPCLESIEKITNIKANNPVPIQLIPIISNTEYGQVQTFLNRRNMHIPILDDGGFLRAT
ncbi:MAG TPA: thioredoxin family protein, partial [Sphingobacteriaceae bacterium]|nr:thioredoxin family protein [Sphingobacteriaceae bacterium]